MRIPFTGEYIAQDWRMGIEEVKRKSIKVQGLKSYFAHLDGVSFVGDKHKNVDNFVRHRMHQMRVDNMSGLEIVRESIPVSYESYSACHEVVGMVERRVPMYRHIYYGYVNT